MQNPARWFVLASSLLIAATSAHAQQGRADLRYVAPLPAVVTFTMIDSVTSKMTGLGPEDIVTSGLLRTIVELRMAATDSGVAVHAALKELTGSMTSPMGSMPYTAPEVPPVDLHIGVQGPAPETAAAMPGSPPNPGNMIGAARLQSALPRLPGRTLRIGETWMDTTRLSMPMGEVTAEIFTETHGTYAADTTVNSKVLNVLNVFSSMKMKMTGKMQGNDVNTEMTGTGEERVLWDSALHIPVFRDVTGHTEMTMQMQDGMTVVNQGKLRTIITSEQ